MQVFILAAHPISFRNVNDAQLMLSKRRHGSWFCPAAEYFLFLLCTLVFCSGSSEASGQSASKPNIVMIIIDDLNDYQEYLLDGHPQSQTPYLNQLARTGVAFQSAYCTTPRSCPSRTSFMAGKDPHYTGVYDNAGVEPVFRDNFKTLARDTVVYTLPEVLRDSGYYTVGINKVYFGWKNEGFDDDYDTLQTDPCLREKSWNDFIVIAPDRHLTEFEDEGVPGFNWAPLNDTLEPYLFDHLATDTAIRLLQEYHSNPSVFCGQSLFLTLGIFLPHKPLILPESYFMPDYLRPNDFYDLPFNKPYNDPPGLWPPNGVLMPPQPIPMWADFDALPPFGQDLAGEGSQHENFVLWPQLLSDTPIVDSALSDEERYIILSEAKRANSVIAYLAAVEYVDRQIGRVLHTLDSLGMDENTIVIVFSDHGYALGEKKHWHKFGLWETDNRIPLIIRHPEMAMGGNVLSPVSTLDIFPTLLDMAGVSHPKFPDGQPYLDGVSLVPFMQNPGLMINRPALTSLRKINGRTRCFVQNSVRDEKFHYIRHWGLGSPASDWCDTSKAVFQEELYLLGERRENDKNEWTNLANDFRYKSVKDYLSQWIADSALFYQSTPRIQMVHETLPCALRLEDTLSLCYSLSSAQGEALTALPPGTTVRYYTSRKPEEKFYTNVFQFRVSQLFNSASYEADKNTLVFVELVDMLSDVVLAQDFFTIIANPDKVPEISFTSTVAGNAVNIENVMFTYVEKIRSYSWTFGDGSSSTLAHPETHVYTEPGSYTISGKVFYGNDEQNLCEAEFSRTVVLSEEDFAGGPCQATRRLVVAEQIGDQAVIHWNTVYGAEGYQIRWRLRGQQDSAYLYATSTENTFLLEGLLSDREYTIQVRSLCDTNMTSQALSEWSYPLTLCTAGCYPPRGVKISDVRSHSAQLNWLPNAQADRGYQIIYRKGTELPHTRYSPTNSLSLLGLDSASTYEVSVYSLCEARPADLILRQDIRSHYFTTDSAQRKHNPSELQSLQLLPNPATHYIQVNWTANSSGNAILRVFNALSHLVFEQEIAQHAGQNNSVIPTLGWATGVYWMTLEDQDARRSDVFQVIR